MTLYDSARAAVTKGHRPGGLHNRNPSHGFGGWKPELKVWTGLASSVTSSLLVDGSLLAVSSHGIFCVCVSVIISSHKHTSQIGLGSTLLPSF